MVRRPQQKSLLELDDEEDHIANLKLIFEDNKREASDDHLKEHDYDDDHINWKTDSIPNPFVNLNERKSLTSIINFQDLTTLLPTLNENLRVSNDGILDHVTKTVDKILKTPVIPGYFERLTELVKEDMHENIIPVDSIYFVLDKLEEIAPFIEKSIPSGRKTTLEFQNFRASEIGKGIKLTFEMSKGLLERLGIRFRKNENLETKEIKDAEESLKIMIEYLFIIRISPPMNLRKFSSNS
ncbi:hypothetical protein Avbf_01506 [Armadillidium vulgare]|nr:hypothetical protein Avbf_01506 [Armadillidium vulgare]